MPDYQYDIKLGYSARDGKWILDDERMWVEVDDIDEMINYLKTTVKLRMEGEILVRRHGNKWYMRDASKYMLFNNPEEMATAFKEIDAHYQDEIVKEKEALHKDLDEKARQIGAITNIYKEIEKLQNELKTSKEQKAILEKQLKQLKK